MTSLSKEFNPGSREKTMISNTDKLYIITRRDLSPAQQAVQAIHAACEFAENYKDLFVSWRSISDYVCLLAVHDETSLLKLLRKVREKNLDYSWFCEPDLEGALTAIALAPGSRSKSFCKNMRLALDDVVSIR